MAAQNLIKHFMLFIWDMLSSVQVSVGLGMGNFGFDERSKIDAHFAWLDFGENFRREKIRKSALHH